MVQRGGSTYGEGERVFGPPLGTYDADWVAAAAVQDGPGVDPDLAQALARSAWEHLRTGDRDEDALTALLVQAAADDPITAAAVARAAVAFCASYGV